MIDIISGRILNAPPPAAPGGGSAPGSAGFQAVSGLMISASRSSMSIAHRARSANIEARRAIEGIRERGVTRHRRQPLARRIRD